MIEILWAKKPNEQYMYAMGINTKHISTLQFKDDHTLITMYNGEKYEADYNFCITIFELDRNVITEVNNYLTWAEQPHNKFEKTLQEIIQQKEDENPFIIKINKKTNE